eukprot:2870865-Prymnesium_polylepis.2
MQPFALIGQRARTAHAPIGQNQLGNVGLRRQSDHRQIAHIGLSEPEGIWIQREGHLEQT